MREVNFSVPGSNKAAVGITTALYDRRALDCTSTLPLINSLNHLAYLTTSSARIREILTVDGGVEKLICILKNGRSKDMMDTWKWNLAFQCVVNIGVRGSDGRTSDNRGSENIRTRVVEADIVPVVATILDNYMQVVEKLRAHTDLERRAHGHPSRTGEDTAGERRSRNRRGESRRDAPPPIAIPASEEQTPADSESDPMDTTAGEGNSESETVAPATDSRQPSADRTHHHHHSRGHRHTHRNEDATEGSPSRLRPPRVDHSHSRTRASTWAASGNTSPVHERDIQFSPQLRHSRNLFSQPDTPTTPTAPANPAASASSSRRTSASPAGQRRLSIRRQASGPEGIPDRGAEILVEEHTRDEPRIENEVDMTDMPENVVLEAAQAENTFTPNIAGDSNTADTFDLPGGLGSDMDPSATPTQRTLPFPGGVDQFAPTAVVPSPDLPPPSLFSRFGPRDRPQSANVLASVPRDEDVIMSLQLLAYVSKYCPLRPYFQQSHLVPKLKIGRELQQVDHSAELPVDADDDNDDEYCQPDDFNIFPLVEKFTVRHHSEDMKYWAGVVMRNLCRKDKARGDIRQCAYYKCGKWEEFARQFAKCRRCRQTKYCSKECQKSAWYV